MKWDTPSVNSYSLLLLGLAIGLPWMAYSLNDLNSHVG